jgi:hypothetical protein
MTRTIAIKYEDLRAIMQRFEENSELQSEKTTYINGLALLVFREDPDLTGPRCPVCEDTGCECCPDQRPSA